MRRAVAALLLVTASALGAQQAPRAQVQPSGPLIQSGGPSLEVADANFPIPPGHVFRVMWEINALPDSSVVSPQITTIARFYNLHARHGVPKANLFGAAVVHGTGWRALLTDEAYQRRFGRPNPSKALVEELIANGARFAVCGQTAGSMGVGREELLPGVQLAISAMTALNVFYAEGYRLQPWR
jgi:intracellular sulfur oxidation DsrE/DsrF family protein